MIYRIFPYRHILIVAMVLIMVLTTGCQMGKSGVIRKPDAAGGMTQTATLTIEPVREFTHDPRAEARQPYLDRVERQLQVVGSRNFPKMARQLGLRGDVRVDFGINGHGEPDDVEIVLSSSFDILDDAARRAIVLAAPFPVPPSNLLGTEGSLRVERLFRYEAPPADPNQPMAVGRLTQRQRQNIEGSSGYVIHGVSVQQVQTEISDMWGRRPDVINPEVLIFKGQPVSLSGNTSTLPDAQMTEEFYFYPHAAGVQVALRIFLAGEEKTFDDALRISSIMRNLKSRLEN
jgi:TonB family protein